MSVKKLPALKTPVILVLSLFFAACAVDRPPSGGPADNTPLEVTSSSPQPGTVGIEPKTIRLSFSHYVTRAALERAIFFSPLIPDYEVKSSGREAEILIHSPLKPGRTYSLTLQRSLRGAYGNELAKSWTLAFSTGTTIDRGSIAGTVWSHRMAPAQNISVMAYLPPAPGAAQPDTIAATPDYLVQTDAAGAFHFENLAEGSYRVIAVDDRNGNLKPDAGKESVGVPSLPAMGSGKSAVAIRLSPADASPAALRSARALNNREIELLFSRNIPLRSFDGAALQITSEATGSPVPILAWFAGGREAETATFRLLVPALDARSMYRIAYSPKDAGTRAGELTVPGSSRTVAYPELSVAIEPADGAANVLLDTIRPESGQAVELRFNLPVADASLKAAVTLAAVAGSVENPVPFTLEKIDSRTWSVKPESGFQAARAYRVTVDRGRVEPLVGSKAGQKAGTTSRFSTAGPDQYGELAGSVRAFAREVVVEARIAGASTARQAVLKPGPAGTAAFGFRNLPPGNYTVSAYVPEGPGSAAFRDGGIHPFVTSSPFAAASVMVRAGWMNEQVNLELPAVTTRRKEAVPGAPAKKRVKKR